MWTMTAKIKFNNYYILISLFENYLAEFEYFSFWRINSNKHLLKRATKVLVYRFTIWCLIKTFSLRFFIFVTRPCTDTACAKGRVVGGGISEIGFAFLLSTSDRIAARNGVYPSRQIRACTISVPNLLTVKYFIQAASILIFVIGLSSLYH